jgi:DNA-directed RNA polymerase subunit RPC12/RpoP
MRLVCSHCQNKFESEDEDPRCPVCLRKRAVPASGKRRGSGLGLNTVEGSQGERRMDLPDTPLSARLGRFFVRAGLGALVFTVLTIRGTLMGMELGGAGFRLYAIVIGGLALGAAWSFFPRLSPVYRERRP